MKKSILIIGMFILICLFCTTVHATDLSGTVNLGPSTTSVKKGETFTVAINVNDIVGDNGWQSFEATIGYDSAFELVKFEGNGNLSNMTAGATINLMSSTSIKSNMQVGTITFKVKEDTTETSGTIRLNGAEIANLQEETASLSGNTVTITINTDKPATQEPENPIDTEQPSNPTPSSEESTDEPTKDTDTKQPNKTNVNSDTATSIIPKTGIEFIAIVSIAVMLITGVIAIIKYKNILK